MADKTYTQEEVDAIHRGYSDQLAQLMAGLLKQQLLQTPQNQFAGPLQQQDAQQTGGNPLFVGTPQGLGTLPGAGTFAPQGVLFAGGSPWPVSSRPAQIQNALAGLNYTLEFLKKSGLLDKLLTKKEPKTASILNPNDLYSLGGQGFEGQYLDQPK